VDDRNSQVLWLHAELGLGVIRQKFGRRFAILLGIDLRPENVGEMTVLEHRGANCGRNLKDLLL
jgi:hypothetical protein